MTADDERAQQNLRRLESEYREMPGLNLTRSQIRRLLAVDSKTCDLLIERLTAAHVLARTADDAYVLSEREG